MVFFYVDLEGFLSRTPGFINSDVGKSGKM